LYNVLVHVILPVTGKACYLLV